MNAQQSAAVGIGPSMVPTRAHPARALVTALSVVTWIGLTLILGFVLDVFWGPDQEGALIVVILGIAIAGLAGVPMAVILALPWWRRAVAERLRAEGRDRALRVLWWSAGLCGAGMLYALRYLAHNPGDWHDVVDEEVTLLPLLGLILFGSFALAARVGWAKVLVRTVFIVFFIPWILYNPIGSLVGLGVMFFGLRALRDVQSEERWSAGAAVGLPIP